MKFLEKDLEEIIYKSNKADLYKRGIEVRGNVKRQFKIGNYGIADIVTFNRDYDEYMYSAHSKYSPFLEVTVYELKKDKIGISAFLQALGYLHGIKRFFQKRDVNYDIKYKIVLVGKTIDTFSTYVYLTDFLIDNNSFIVENYTYQYDIDGIKFKNECNYKLTNEGFNDGK